MLAQIALPLSLSLLFLVLISSFIDRRKKREITNYPFISFIIPAYNAEKMVEKSIRSVYSSYNRKNFELFVINDSSRDDTLNVLKRLQKELHFKLIDNKKNLGKAASLNNAVKSAKGEIIFITDSDTQINKHAVNDAISRLENEKVAAVSCRYKPMNSNFMSKMQLIEYCMTSLNQTVHGFFSVTNVWGGCMAIKREALDKVGEFSENALTEDVDLALRMGENNLRVVESPVAVYTEAPTDIKSWYKQRKRWSATGVYSYFNHPRFLLTHPVNMIFLFSYLLIIAVIFSSIFNSYVLFQNIYYFYGILSGAGYSFILSVKLLGQAYGGELAKMATLSVIGPLFLIPYAIFAFPKVKKLPKNILWVFPFAIAYLPAYLLLNLILFPFSLYKIIKLRIKGGRGW